METLIENVPDAASDRHSHPVPPQEMEWQKTRFPGCEAELPFDREYWSVTALMRFAPGAVLPITSTWGVEETHVIEGKPSTRKDRHRARRGPGNSSGARPVAGMRPGARRATDPRDLPGARTSSSSRGPRRRCRRSGLGSNVGAHRRATTGEHAIGGSSQLNCCHRSRLRRAW